MTVRRVALALVLGSAAPLAAQTSLTIYTDGRVLQRRTVPLAIPAGGSVHQLTLGALDPGSIFALDSGVVITGARYEPAVDFGAALRRAVGRELTFETRGVNGAREAVTATVLGVDPERYRLANGRISFERPGSPLFPAEMVPTQSALSVAMRSDKARNGLGLGFFSSGAAWSATYAVVLGRGTARISGVATIAAGTLKADSAEIQLLAGNVGVAQRPGIYMKDMAARAAAPMAMEAAQQQSVGEAHLYTLAGRYSIEPGVETSAMLFEPASAPWERTFTVRGQIPWYGGLGQQGDEQVDPVAVTYVIKRGLKTGFGDVPVPGGVARIYERDQAGRPQLVGESSLDHTAAGQDLRLDAGTAFDLTAKRIQSDYETHREGNRTVATAGYRVALDNAKDDVATVDVLEQRGGEWAVTQSSIPAEKATSTLTRFRVRVPAGGRTVLTYRVRVVW